MNNPYIRIYPVGNGSLTLLKTATEKFILIDCKLRDLAEGDNDKSICDCKADLLKRLPKDSKNRPYVDLFVLTHPDLDHCQGFAKHFYTGDQANYTSKNNKDEILIDELWVTKLVTDKEACDDAKTIEKERKRRYKLYSGDDRSNESSYNRLSMIGYDSEEKYSECPSHVPGETVEYWAGTSHSDASIFIHGPFKESLVTDNANENKEEKDRKNNSSVIAQYTLYDSSKQKAKLELLEGGDADHYRWEKVKTITEDNNNGERLNFDVFITPHHCSWGFFNDRPYKENKIANQSSIDLVKNYSRKSSFVVANSKPIEHNDDNPPHGPAKDEYRSAMKTAANFKCTGEYPKKSEPSPIHFELKDGSIILNLGAVANSASYNKYKSQDRGRSYSA
jgi:ribonuclease BN (tRNA processing enzyme)